MISQEILSSIPDYADSVRIEDWAEKQVRALHNATISPQQRDSFVALSPADIHPFNESSRQQFINATLLADWACYAAPEDRAEYPRMRDVITTFPQGFRVWFCRMPDNTHRPVAYTGWYPLPEETFNKAHDRPQNIKHRKELWPQNALSPGGDYIWIFNYSILKQLRKSEQSRKMLQTCAADINAIKPRGLVTAVISEESKPVACRFGMHHVGNMTHAGVSEEVWAARFPATKPHPKQKPELI